jgi:predicted GH43/DUF377 family glycosyl hydrolase
VSESGLAVRLDVKLRPDPRRVIARLFVPGEELPEGASRGRSVIDRIQELDDATVSACMAGILAGFAGRHRDLEAILHKHFQVAAHGRPEIARLPEAHQLLVGAYFTMEYAVESAALFNPSMVAHPDQTGLAPGQLRFVMSVRAVGEGHLSSVEFRTGILGPGSGLVIDEPDRTLVTGVHTPGVYHRELFQARLADLGADRATVELVLGSLPDRFDLARLRGALSAQRAYLRDRQSALRAIEQINQVADANYTVTFPPDSPIGQRVLWPGSSVESHGMEDVRLVRFVGDDGESSYYGTYTAYDGDRIAPQLFTTTDFAAFEVGQLAGPAARNKGMAMFPRRLAGRYLALSRWDRENVSLCMSDDAQVWHHAETLQTPREPWQLVQLGNCGSPIDTGDGWLVLTHGVGPMRTYSIGVMLLDHDNPAQVRAALRAPLLAADNEERDGYVPNVVYSCGALLHGDTLTVPYGISDAAIGFAQVDLPTLLHRMRQDG